MSLIWRKRQRVYEWSWTFEFGVCVGMMTTGGEGEACRVGNDGRIEFRLLFVALAERVGWG